MSRFVQNPFEFTLQQIHSFASKQNSFPWHEVLIRPQGQSPITCILEAEAENRVHTLDIDILRLAMPSFTCGRYSVNMSTRTLLHDHLDRWLDIAETRPKSSQLIVEITERLPISRCELSAACNALNRLRRAGIMIAFDDIDHIITLATMPVLLTFADVVKISNACGDMLHLAKSFLASHSVVVESVSSASRLNAARASGAQHWQGFFDLEPSRVCVNYDMPLFLN